MPPGKSSEYVLVTIDAIPGFSRSQKELYATIVRLKVLRPDKLLIDPFDIRRRPQVPRRSPDPERNRPYLTPPGIGTYRACDAVVQPQIMDQVERPR